MITPWASEDYSARLSEYHVWAHAVFSGRTLLEILCCFWKEDPPNWYPVCCAFFPRSSILMSQLNFLHCTNNAKKVIVLLRSHCGKLVLPLKHIYRNIHYHHNLVHIKQYMRSFVNTYKTVGGSDKLGLMFRTWTFISWYQKWNLEKNKGIIFLISCLPTNLPHFLQRASGLCTLKLSWCC
jgi:hypothetical protein